MSNTNADSAPGTLAQGDNLELNQQFKKLSINPHDPKSEQRARESGTKDIEPKEVKQDKGKEIAKAGPSDARASTPNTTDHKAKPGYSFEIVEFDDNWEMGWQPDPDMFDTPTSTRPLPQVQEDPIGQELADALDNLTLNRVSLEDRRYIAQLFMTKPYVDIKLELEMIGIVYDDLTSEDLYEIIAIMTRSD